MIGVVEEPNQDAAPADRAAAKAQRIEQKAALRQQRLDDKAAARANKEAVR